MEGTTATKHHQRKILTAAGQHATEMFGQASVLLRRDGGMVALDRLFPAHVTTFEAKARLLAYPNTDMLWRAYDGDAVSSELIVAVRRRFPDVPYERLFTEGHCVTETYAVMLRAGALDDLFHAEGINSYAAKARELGYPSTSLFRAYQGGAVSSALIAAVRRRYPKATYEQVFTEGRITGERKVSADAPADLAA